MAMAEGEIICIYICACNICAFVSYESTSTGEISSVESKNSKKKKFRRGSKGEILFFSKRAGKVGK